MCSACSFHPQQLAACLRTQHVAPLAALAYRRLQRPRQRHRQPASERQPIDGNLTHNTAPSRLPPPPHAPRSSHSFRGRRHSRAVRSQGGQFFIHGLSARTDFLRLKIGNIQHGLYNAAAGEHNIHGPSHPPPISTILNGTWPGCRHGRA